MEWSRKKNIKKRTRTPNGVAGTPIENDMILLI